MASMRFVYTPSIRRKYFDFILLRGFLIVMVVMTIPWYIRMPGNTPLILSAFGFGYFLITIGLPTVILFINHKLHSSGTTVVIDDVARTIEVSQNRKITKCSFDEVESIVCFLAPPLYDNRPDILGWGKYTFSRITTKNNSTILISCLVLDNYHDVFPQELLVFRKILFPMIPKHSRE